MSALPQDFQIGRKASLKFWDRQTSLVKEDMEDVIGAKPNKINLDAISNSKSGHQHQNSPTLINNTHLINVR